jgi:hypothetical protein
MLGVVTAALLWTRLCYAQSAFGPLLPDIDAHPKLVMVSFHCTFFSLLGQATSWPYTPRHHKYRLHLLTVGDKIMGLIPRYCAQLSGAWDWPNGTSNQHRHPDRVCSPLFPAWGICVPGYSTGSVR